MTGLPTGLAGFNEAPREESVALLTRCADVPRWAEEVADGRPYADLPTLLESARSAADPWTEQEVDRALAGHPRIGERPTGRGGATAHSAREQAGVGRDEETTRRLTEGNRAYEERFGHVFLIRARGRTGAEILAELERRLANDPATERAEAAAQLREIALLRLETELGDTGDTGDTGDAGAGRAQQPTTERTERP
ncbi:2-oxo-4-hydroxy-4-carboxy-5-ureidoimidazoline decarboxylase [Ornithinicoccus halotolerans]|uniref:2-oxo-4-hydroxy-4-carboxy-5-ureidoimidazoline decarboxylase n=1 Tax=Ornithinicoccus halotolerans TaxID=1748220 RepID=UPI001297E528|nr:2-oxo-4-hydroxy-4-carboxy-5-ureidoimidazoline decarboxylase [Ornithinicoccus halotolerans]